MKMAKIKDLTFPPHVEHEKENSISPILPKMMIIKQGSTRFVYNRNKRTRASDDFKEMIKNLHDNVSYRSSLLSQSSH